MLHLKWIINRVALGFLRTSTLFPPRVTLASLIMTAWTAPGARKGSANVDQTRTTGRTQNVEMFALQVRPENQNGLEMIFFSKKCPYV